ncbi:MAG: hypothetical protein K2M98_05835 [Muribaculum sp.]|nr:hypothetical protein [Muribaculum sp.]
MDKSLIIRRLLSASLIIISAVINAVAHTDDNVFIVDGSETWQLVAPSGNKGAYVKNIIDHTYEATRYREQIKPMVIYNDRMTLGSVWGKGNKKYDSATSDNIFHDDNRVCYLEMNLDGPGKKAKAHFERTLIDPAFFTRIYLADNFPIRHKEVKIIIPAEYPGISVEELNFTSDDGADITRREETAANGTRTYIYTLNNLDGTEKPEKEAHSPYPLLYQPVLLIKGWFNSVDDLSRWHADMSQTETEIPDIDKFLTEEVYRQSGQSLSPRERLNKIYSWVQSNIRYLAYEEGERGHRPDQPAEVIRKRNGDCKGMSLLLATLLNHEGIDASTAIIGTDNIPYSIGENCTLGATNHCICIAVESGDTLYLDATNEYIPATHIPDAIQGKDAIVMSGSDNKWHLITVPRLSAAATALDSICYEYSLSAENKALSGTVTRSLSGDLKESYLTRYSQKGDKYAAEHMAIDLVPGRRSVISEEELAINRNLPDGTTVIEAPIINSEAVTDAYPMVYLDLNSKNGVDFDRIDNHDRRSPYRLPSRGRIVRMSRVKLPDGAKVTYIPDNFTVSTPQASFQGIFSTPEPDTVELIKVIEINNLMLAPDDIDLWNKTISAWNNACKNQIEISFE